MTCEMLIISEEAGSARCARFCASKMSAWFRSDVSRKGCLLSFRYGLLRTFVETE